MENHPYDDENTYYRKSRKGRVCRMCQNEAQQKEACKMTFSPLMTDRYEFSMLQTFVNEGMVNKRVTFEVFTRRLTPGHRFGVFAGLGRLLPMLENFTFRGAEVSWMEDNNIINAPTAEYLKNFHFDGRVLAYNEGDLYFPYSPVLTVEATLGEALLVETLILSVLNFDSGIAGKAARIKEAARGGRLIEMGSRRTHEEGAVAAARAAYIAGFSATSNLQASYEYGVPSAGTAAHAFTLAFMDETEAFTAQIEAQGIETTLLVDTYNVEQGTLNAITAARKFGATGPGAVRIDSGDLAANARAARKILDANGAEDTLITVTSDLDEHVIKDLLYQNAPVDGYGVGTKLVAAPSAGFVYKMVEMETEDPSPAPGHPTYMRPVAKKSKDKMSNGGKKYAYRVSNAEGQIVGELLEKKFYESSGSASGFSTKPLQTVVMNNGITTGSLDSHERVAEARSTFRESLRMLPEGERSVWSGTDHGPFLTAEFAS